MVEGRRRGGGATRPLDGRGTTRGSPRHWDCTAEDGGDGGGGGGHRVGGVRGGGTSLRGPEGRTYVGSGCTKVWDRKRRGGNEGGEGDPRVCFPFTDLGEFPCHRVVE